MNKLSYIILTLSCALLWACGPVETERNSDFGIQGIDVSHHQQDVDWNTVATQDFHFAFLKASEGLQHVDPNFSDNWASAKTSGLVRGAYHFFRANKAAEDQLRNFTNRVELQPGDLPPVLDIETLDGATREELIAGVRTWLYLAEIKYGVKPVIYTNLKFYYRYLAGQFDDYPYWMARYGTKEPTVGPGLNLAFWQYGDRGRVAGIKGNVDLNVFYGDQAAFDELLIRESEIFTVNQDW
ncbi:MAG: glycoside hydrolase family 25 protein [Saprospiraceae bacterium]